MRPRRTLFVGLTVAFATLVLLPAHAGTVAEQRERLPPQAKEDACAADPVAGVWRGHAYYPRQGQWYIFTLTVERAGADNLKGRIDLRGWDAGPSDPNPQPCRPGFRDFTVIEPAEGTLHGLEIDFGGTSWTRGKPGCEDDKRDYILDRFVGHIDPAIQEFQSVNRYPMNGQIVEDVTVFRRIQCFGQDTSASAGTGPAPPVPTSPGTAATPSDSPPPAVPPPPMNPDERRGGFGCGCGH